tara:strand:+ start:161 stop:439 length:279 start_codon:yes stop_codon:yes gene_type:complete
LLKKFSKNLKIIDIIIGYPTIEWIKKNLGGIILIAISGKNCGNNLYVKKIVPEQIIDNVNVIKKNLLLLSLYGRLNFKNKYIKTSKIKDFKT